MASAGSDNILKVVRPSYSGDSYVFRSVTWKGEQATLEAVALIDETTSLVTYSVLEPRFEKKIRLLITYNYKTCELTEIKELLLAEISGRRYSVAKTYPTTSFTIKIVRPRPVIATK